MQKTQLLAFMLTVIFLFSTSAYADSEFRESRKCSSMFAYFEKRYNIPKDTLYSISLQETQKAHSQHNIGLVWPWTVNIEGKGWHFKNKNEAIKFVYAQMANGKKSIDVGCMQINLKYHPDAFVSVEQAFSPRKNIAYAAKLLKDNYNQIGSWDKAIGKYHSRLEDVASKYQARVTKISNSMITYKQNLSNYTYNTKYKKRSSQSDLDRVTKSPNTKYLGMSKVQVRVGKLKDDHWFRRTQN